MKTFDIISVFPDILDDYFNASILGRAQQNELITINTHDFRDSAINKHGQIDDTPYGGGAGMVIRIDVAHAALKKIYKRKNKKTRVILLSPRGKTYDQRDAVRLSAYDRLILLSGRYEAIDARIDAYVDEKLSIGNFILTGGELAAACVVDSVARLIPGVVGKEASVEHESFSDFSKDETTIEHPHYTKPEQYDGQSVPDILLSGNHEKIDRWRKHNSKKILL